MEAFFWSGRIFSGIENKDKGQQKEAVGKEQWQEEVTGTEMAEDRNTVSAGIASHVAPLVTVPSRQKHAPCAPHIVFSTAS